MRQPADSATLSAWASHKTRASGRPGWLRRMLAWFNPRAAAPNLKASRQACIDCLADLPPLQVRSLCQLLANAKTLSDLWQLRAEVYRVLALHHSQGEAERRLARTGVFMERRGRPRQRQT